MWRPRLILPHRRREQPRNSMTRMRQPLVKMAPVLTSAEVDNLLRPLTHKDLRVQTRARNLSPAGGVEALKDRLKEAMLSSGDFALKDENGEDLPTAVVVAGLSSEDTAHGKACNNYVRPAGQNVGNFLTERNSSRVLAPPGGASQICFGSSDAPAPPTKTGRAADVNPISGQAPDGKTGSSNNNYARPSGQNVGNYITDRSSSRVLAPPGGASQIIFG
ncbi:hypothetical protein QJQ45_026705 [Haematococcus lacustris]|nr:hypothetical protein QJQ45_026705 [Haematococcus lacustris]